MQKGSGCNRTKGVGQYAIMTEEQEQEGGRELREWNRHPRHRWFLCLFMPWWLRLWPGAVTADAVHWVAVRSGVTLTERL